MLPIRVGPIKHYVKMFQVQVYARQLNLVQQILISHIVPHEGGIDETDHLLIEGHWFDR